MVQLQKMISLSEFRLREFNNFWLFTKFAIHDFSSHIFIILYSVSQWSIFRESTRCISGSVWFALFQMLKVELSVDLKKIPALSNKASFLNSFSGTDPSHFIALQDLWLESTGLALHLVFFTWMTFADKKS